MSRGKAVAGIAGLTAVIVLVLAAWRVGARRAGSPTGPGITTHELWRLTSPRGPKPLEMVVLPSALQLRRGEPLAFAVVLLCTGREGVYVDPRVELTSTPWGKVGGLLDFDDYVVALQCLHVQVRKGGREVHFKEFVDRARVGGPRAAYLLQHGQFFGASVRLDQRALGMTEPGDYDLILSYYSAEPLGPTDPPIWEGTASATLRVTVVP